MTSKWPLLISTSMFLFFVLCAIAALPFGCNPSPQPTATLERNESGISEERWNLLMAQSYITATGDNLKYNITTFWRSLKSEEWKITSQGTDWVVEFCFTMEDESQCATWLYHPDTDFLESLDYWGRFFFNNQAGF